MEVQLLGPVGVEAEGGSVQLGAPKERAVLAILALAGDAVVSEGTLIDGIWGDDPPRTAPKILQNLVLKVRKPFRTLDLPDPIATRPGGYQLAGEASVDLRRVEALRARARDLATDNPAQAVDLYREALACWRGDALADLGDLPVVLVEGPRLAELRLTLLEARIDAELELGRHTDVVAELEALCAAHPLREYFLAQRMIALYRCGRQAEALRAFQAARAVLADELGLDPSPRLVSLERSIAAEDPSLLHDEDPWPSGTVTFLFTDIEASTKILTRAPEAYAVALEDHNRLLRAVWTSHRGIEVNTVGDAFFVAFQHATDALAAAVAAQRALAAHAWPEGARLKVRMGAHTGEAQPVGRDYVAVAVHQASRVANTGHGGQVVASEACIASLSADGGGLPPGLALVDLGLHQVRDFGLPVRLHQVGDVGAAGTFPTLRTLGYLSSNLPQSRTSFIGRAADRAEITGLLGRTRVVTLLGPGGVGKTRLAIELGRTELAEFPDGVFMADLSPVADDEGVARAIAEALAVPEQEGEAVGDTLLASLRTKRILLLLDNCEHVIDAAAEIVERITGACADTAILATSREALRVDGEAIWRLSPLRVPVGDGDLSVDELAACESVQLFVERVQLVQPGFVLDDSVAAAVASVVSELDGIPLAIELAAAAAGQLSIDELVAGLDDRFNVLTNGRRTAPARQQTLYAVVDWSFGLLAEPEQQLLRRLAVFSGTFSSEAVDAVAAPARGALDRLVSASLVVPVSSFDADAPVRYRLLETVRAFAQSQLDDAGEADAVRTAHLDWALQLATDAHAEVRGPEAPRVLQAVERDHDNLRAALAWGVGGGRPATGVALAAKLVAFWDARGHRIEGVGWLQDSLAAAGDDIEPTVKIDALIELAGISMTNDLEQSMAAFHDAVAQADLAADDHRGAIARMGLGMLLGNHGFYDEAIPLLDASLAAFRQIGDLHNTALALERLSDLVRDQGDVVRYRELIDEAIELQRASGDRRELFWSVASLSQRAIMNGERERAVVGLVEARALIDEIDYVDGDAWLSCCEGMFQLADGNVEAATERFDHALEVVRATQELVIIEWAAAGVAWCAASAGALAKARSALVELNEVGVMGVVPRTKFYRALHAARTAAAGGQWELAARLWCGAQAIYPVHIPVPAAQDVVDMQWLDEVLPRELGEDPLEALRDDARRSCESGTNPVDEAFKHFEAWSPADGTHVEGPPMWRPW